MNGEAIRNAVRNQVLAEQAAKAAMANATGYSVSAANSGNALFQVHAAGCADIAKNTARTGQAPFANVATIEAVGEAIANCYGGYGYGDAPADLGHALSWAKVHGCVRTAGLKAVAK